MINDDDDDKKLTKKKTIYSSKRTTITNNHYYQYDKKNTHIHQCSIYKYIWIMITYEKNKQIIEISQIQTYQSIISSFYVFLN